MVLHPIHPPVDPSDVFFPGGSAREGKTAVAEESGANQGALNRNAAVKSIKKSEIHGKSIEKDLKSHGKKTSYWKIPWKYHWQIHWKTDGDLSHGAKGTFGVEGAGCFKG